MKRFVCVALMLTMLTVSLTACGSAGGGKAVSSPEPSQTGAVQAEGKTVRGIINRMGDYLVLLTEQDEYQIMDFGEGVTMDDFAEEDRVEVTYTGELGVEGSTPVIVAITKVD